MRSMQTKMIVVISVIMVIVVGSFLMTSTNRTNMILVNDSDQILRSTADYYTNIIDDNFRSAEQSVGTMYNYAMKRSETYSRFLLDEDQRDLYTYDISELGKSIAENTRGAMAVYLRYNPEDFGSVSGFWYTIKLDDNTWQPSVPTDMSLYDKDDVEHVGWYYIPVSTGKPMWMDPYYNANLGVDMISYIIPYYYGGYTVGIIGMDISMELLKEAVAEVSVYESGCAFLITKDGDLIYHEDYPKGITFDELSESDKNYFSGLLNSEFDNVIMNKGRDGQEQKLILKELRNGMILGIYAPTAEINAPQAALLRQQLFISAIILFLSIIFCLLWVRTITKPIQKMTKVSEHYANGDFDEELSIHRADELGTLSHSLQTMATSLKQQIDISDSANRAKSEFLANMSHEIRTPINAVLGMNEMILRESDEENILDYAESIQSSGRTLLALINSILDFSKIEDGKMEILPVEYDTVTFIHDQMTTVAERARAKDLELKTSVDDGLPTKLLGDDVRIGQIVNNLLTNAVKYTERGEVRLSCTCRKYGEDEIDLSYEISDTGIGIRPEDIERLTESFSRLEEKRNRNVEGTGLGMSIVTKLLDMMDSRLDIESVYGVGSKFSFTIRQKVVDPTPIGNYEEHEKKHDLSRKAEKQISYEGAKVLVVDDHEMNLKVAKSLMGVFGIKPDLASGGLEAISMVKEKQYNIIFMDHMMPQIDGIEALSRMKKQDLLSKRTKVIALTANAIVGARETYMAAGFDDYLTKPIEMGQLKRILAMYIPQEFAKEVKAEKAENTGSAVSDVKKPDSTVKTEKAEKTGKTDVPRKATFDSVGISEEDGIRNSGNSKELFMELLVDYTDEYDEKKQRMEQEYNDRDWDNYRIQAHSLKSASKTIGAMMFSEKAAEAEALAKEKDEAGLREIHSDLMARYADTVEGIRAILADRS